MSLTASPSGSPSIETRASLKRQIASLQLENAQLACRLIKTPLHSYVREGRAIRRLVTLTLPVTNLIAEYDRRCILVEDSEGEIESLQSSDQEERIYRAYKKLIVWCPSVKGLMNPATPEREVVAGFQDLKSGADAARGDDTNSLKSSVAGWINEQELPQGVPVLVISEKKGRGFNHEVTGRFLCPVDYNWSDATTRSGIREYLPSYIVTAYMWPTFLYSNGAYNKQHPSDGLFKGELLVRAFRCVFTSPSSARAETAADSLEAMELHDDAPNCDQSSPRKSRKTVDSIHTRDHVAGLLKMRSVQPRAIAYIAVQLRFALSSHASWNLKDDNFDYEIFYDNIVDWFECPRSQAKAREIEDLLLWWNRTVFGHFYSSTLQPHWQEAENLSVAMSRN